jgi:hypothetical protein
MKGCPLKWTALFRFYSTPILSVLANTNIACVVGSFHRDDDCSGIGTGLHWGFCAVDSHNQRLALGSRHGRVAANRQAGQITCIRNHPNSTTRQCNSNFATSVNVNSIFNMPKVKILIDCELSILVAVLVNMPCFAKGYHPI